VAIWYFEVTTDTKGRGTILRSIKWLIIYHWGTVVFGSLVISVSQLIRLLFEYQRKIVGTMNPKNPLTFCLQIICCCQVQWSERCLKFMTKNAYIQTAITNQSFCPAAFNAYTLMIKHAPRLG